MKRSYLLKFLPILTAAMLMLTTAAVAGPTNSPLAAINPDKPNDAAQGRLRINMCVEGAPQLDIYVDDQPATNGGVPQFLRADAKDTTGYLYLPPATYSITLAAGDQNFADPYFGPLDVAVAAGHRYTVVVLGQKEDATHKALVIDETAAYQAVGAYPPDSQHIGHITVNNIKGAPSIRFSLGGVPQEKSTGAAYGEYIADTWPSFAKGIGLSTTTSPSETLFNDDEAEILNAPGSDNMDCVFGVYPANDSHTTASTSQLNPTDFLQRFNDLGASTAGKTPTFNTFLSAVNRSGLTQLLDTGGPYMILAPSDDAFSSMSQSQLSALMSNPSALSDVVRSHVVPGYFPVSTLGKRGASGGIDRIVTNMLGATLVLTGGEQLIVNGNAIAGGGDYAMVANGTRLFWTSKVLLPSTPTVTPAPPPSCRPPGRAQTVWI